MFISQLDSSKFSQAISLVATFFLAWCGNASALPISSTDLWNGATVTSYTGIHPNSDIRDMFGGAFSAVETTNTVFPDGLAQGTVHAVEWKTSSAVTLRSFVLNAQHDGPIGSRDANYRGFSTFNLYAYDGAVFDLIFSYNPANPYNTSIAPPNGIIDNAVGYGFLSLGVNINPVTTDRFRAEFVQFGVANGHADGPRIRELDGFDTYLRGATTPIPEPETYAMLLAGLGLLGFVARRRRKQQA